MSEQRLIDANELTLEICKRKGCFGTGEGNEPFMAWEIEDYIKDAPTVDAAPVIHAHWEIETEKGGYKHTICSNCGAEQAITFSECGNKYCDACGARMDEVV